MDTKEKLDQLADFMAERDLIAIHKQELIDQVLTPEIKAKIHEIEAEFAGNVETVDKKISDLEAEIKGDVIVNGATVKGASLMAVWNKGRTSWNTSVLDGLAIVFPKLLEAKTIGQPTCSIRKA